MKPAEKYRAWKAHRPEKPIFRTILFSMMAVLMAEVTSAVLAYSLISTVVSSSRTTLSPTLA